MDFPNFTDFNQNSQSAPFSLASNKPLESVLVADCGSNTTHVVLIDVVDNAYRFIARGEAPSTLEAPYADVTIGVLNAIASIEANTGRHLLIGGQLITPQQEDGSGVDALVASSSAAEALRVVAVGLVRDLSAKTCARASHGTYTMVLDTLSLDDYGDETDDDYTLYDPQDPQAEFSPFAFGSAQATLERDEQQRNPKRRGLKLFGERKKGFWRERQIARLRRLDPNIVVLSGGDGKVVQPLLRLVDVVLESNRQEMVLASATGETHQPPTLLFAGNAEAQEAVISRVAGQVEFYGIDNIRPGGVFENLYPLQRQLSALYQERLLPTLPGFTRLSNLCSTPINTTCNAVGLMTQFLARDVADNRVLTADIGGANSALFYADSQDFISLVRGNFGLSFGLSNVLAEVEAAAVQRWLPFEATLDEIIHYALNKTMRPQILPADERELMLEGAFVREALRRMYHELSTESSQPLDFNRIVGVGRPLVNINPWHAALTLLDGIEPRGSQMTGLFDLELDSTMLMAAAGALASFNANVATYVFRYDCLHRLGPCIVPLGEAAIGSNAVTVTLVASDGRKRKTEVAFGSIAILPLRADEQASLEIVPGRNFRIGQAARGVTVRTEPGQEVSGGSIGLIIDARGRPIKLNSNPATRIQDILKWQQAMTEMLKRAETETEPDPPPPSRAKTKTLPAPAPAEVVTAQPQVVKAAQPARTLAARLKNATPTPAPVAFPAPTSGESEDPELDGDDLRQAFKQTKIKGKGKSKDKAAKKR